MLRRSLLIVAVGLSLSAAWSDAPRVELSRDGRALVRIVVAPSAGPDSRKSARTLAQVLDRISGASFEVAQGDGASGIAVGTAAEFSGIPTPGLDPRDPERREEYLLQSHTRGLRVVGATPLAVRHGVWDLLHRLGYRQYFPGKHWEVVPNQPRPALTVDVLERPSYHSRRIWYGFGPWDYARDTYADWCEKNRCVQGVELNTGHAYDGVVAWGRKEFEAHPEFWPLLAGERKPVRNPKPCLGNPAVRELFVRYALERLAKDPELQSVSMDPSDGGGWCECDRCKALGSVSDQVVTLANQVAAALQTRKPGALVGIYAYNYHSPPPSIRVHERVVVSVATAFIKGGQSLDEIVNGWAAKGARLGIREYYGVNVWDRDQPGQARGGNLSYLTQTIPDFHRRGARFMSAESSDNWGPNGLGYYLSSRVLWDVREAARSERLVSEFLRDCFGPAAGPMREFYEQLDSARPHLVADDQIGRMYRAIDRARAVATGPEVRARLDDLLLYTRYCSLYQRYATSDGAARQPAFEALIRHAYRMRTTSLIHTYALYRDLPRRDKSVTLPDGADYEAPEGRNPWKSSEPFQEAELAAFLREGIERHPLVKLDFTPVRFSDDLAPAAARLGLPGGAPVGSLGAGRGEQSFYIHAPTPRATVELALTGGLIAQYRDRGNIRVEVRQIGGASETGEKDTLVAQDRSVPPDGVERTIRLRLKAAGLHRIKVTDGGDRTLVRWPGPIAPTVRSSESEPMNPQYQQWMAYFYVPKGVRTIGLYGGDHGEIRDSLDRPHFWLNGKPRNYYSVPVPPGQDGKIWHIRYANGPVRLLTVPPYLSLTPDGLLLPRELIEKDAR